MASKGKTIRGESESLPMIWYTSNDVLVYLEFDSFIFNTLYARKDID